MICEFCESEVEGIVVEISRFCSVVIESRVSPRAVLDLVIRVGCMQGCGKIRSRQTNATAVAPAMSDASRASSWMTSISRSSC